MWFFRGIVFTLCVCVCMSCWLPPRGDPGNTVYTLWRKPTAVLIDVWCSPVIEDSFPYHKLATWCEGDQRFFHDGSVCLRSDGQSSPNWRRISLLDVAGKVFAQILQDRLLIVAEKVLPETQCGFRKRRGCIDMIFAARQLIEKTREHADSLFTLFVDLKKAYDSVPRQALWHLLEKYGVPPVMLSLIKSLHEGMNAVVRVGDSITDPIAVSNGLRQGCTLAPMLFNLYFSAVVRCWRDRCPQAGITVKYRVGRKLVGDRTAKRSLQEMCMTESQFADDAALYTNTREEMDQVAREFVRTAAEWGLTVSIEKTKLLVVGKDMRPEDSRPLQLDEGEITSVCEFTYLGNTITKDGEVNGEVVARLAKASRAFGYLRSAIFRNKRISVATKREVYQAAVLSTLLYGAETWTVKADSVRKLRGFHNRCIRCMLGVSRLQQWKERITSRELAKAFGMTESVTDILRKHRLRWLGHVARMDNNRIPKQLLFGELLRPRPSKRRWRDLARGDVQLMGLGETWYEAAQDRNRWTNICKDCQLEDLEDRQHGFPNHRAVETHLHASAGALFGAKATLHDTAVCNGPDYHQDQSAATLRCQCGRSFGRQGDLTRHRRYCSGTQVHSDHREITIECRCGRTFRRRGDLTRHLRFCSEPPDL